ncbi:YdeI/OmpD-associated family protein [Lysobacter solisilvae (ex Woo and Kim 2020)]|uniref:YdeI/OmpD-associated family protein n=1 Tax=Agrilutibacter terrestris TaxID=2865112 RepID=A0A7H0FWR3_9GAMM|nr:YdeI/OmpD-associated family protein [Lysobacter terrestris]QNP40479.1 YdeI/OmpD-associated family protein [Lysobacter terrestris]
MVATQVKEFPIKLFRTRAAWEKWLAAHGDAPGVWVQVAKKDSGETSVSQNEAIEGALCHGWIDGQKRAMDEAFYLLRFTPRRPRSVWSKINIAKVEQLIASGRMQPAGLREVEAAKRDGRWDAAYEGSSRMEVPQELADALATSERARGFFEQLDRTNRYAFCWRVHTAKKPETRRARAEKFVAMMARGEKIHA